MKSLTEFLVDSLEHISLFEMGYERKDYKKTVRGLKDQIIQNWCLIRYCTLINREETKEHWKKELLAHLSNLQRMSLKLDKTKATKEELYIYPDFDNYENIRSCIELKFMEEDIDYNSDEVTQVCKDCSEYGIEEMISIICAKKVSVLEIKDYLDNI